MNIDRRNWLNDILELAAKDSSLDLSRATEVSIIEMSLTLERIEQRLATVIPGPAPADASAPQLGEGHAEPTAAGTEPEA